LSNPVESLARFDLVVPVYNEGACLPELFRRLQALGLEFHAIFIDNASTDNSLALLKTWPGATVIEHACNEGYGGSLIDGMTTAETDYIVIIDADCEYPPEALPQLVNALMRNSVVYASRFKDPALARQAGMGLVKTWGNKLFSAGYNCLFNQATTDLYTGCKGLQRKTIEGMVFEHKGFEHVLELAVKLSARGYRIVDIPILFEARTTGSSKMSYLADSARYFVLLAHYTWRKWRGRLQA